VGTRPIRVLITGGDDTRRAALTTVIAGRAGGFEMAVAGGEADVVLVDIEIDGGGAEQLVRTLRPTGPVIAYGESADRREVVAMFRAGASGYLTKDTSPDDLVHALTEAAAGRATISAAAAPAVVEELAHHLRAQELILDEERGRLEQVRRVLDESLVGTVFQPIVAVDTREPAGYEALTRIALEPSHPPDHWFFQAWQVGLGAELELLAIRTALGHLDLLPPWAYLAVNVSPDVVASGALSGVIDTVDSNRIVVEMTEHAPVLDYDQLAKALAPLRAAGVRVSVDDTGAGFASLRHILLLDPHFIKLDGSITRNIDKDPARLALARGLVSFARDINAHIVGEGVETESELEALRRLGVSSAQGYLFGRPAPLPPPNLGQ
jgi:EAL domain-containing protein (putative c-di-GMP-specific phosphodiesterase class I)/CheY-like chemotaxis protein